MDIFEYDVIAKLTQRAMKSWGKFARFYREDDSFVQNLKYGPDRSVVDVIDAWLKKEKGFYCVCGFPSFLMLVSFFVDDYHRRGALPVVVYGGSDEDLQQNKVTKHRVVCVLGTQALHRIFDPDYFAWACIRS